MYFFFFFIKFGPPDLSSVPLNSKDSYNYNNCKKTKSDASIPTLQPTSLLHSKQSHKLILKRMTTKRTKTVSVTNSNLYLICCLDCSLWGVCHKYGINNSDNACWNKLCLVTKPPRARASVADATPHETS